MNNKRCDKQLWSAIYDLNVLLGEKKNEEALYQNLFEKHPIIFSVLGIDIAKSFEKSSPYSLPYDLDREFTPEPDFIGVELPAGNLNIIELKTPFVGGITTARQDGNRVKFKANAESYISQATEYVETIRERHEAREVVKTVLGFERIADYRVKLIYGLREDSDAHSVSRIVANRKTPTEIIFYDELLNKLINVYSVARGDIASRSGWVFVFHIYLSHIQPANKVVLAEYGGEGQDKVLVCLENGNLIFECIDSENKSYCLESSLERSGPHYVRFEFSNDSDGIYMSLNVNNVETDLKIGEKKLNLDPDLDYLTLGTDSNGNNGAHFYMFENYAVNRTMDIKEKLDSYYYFKKKMGEVSKCLEFKPQHFMVRQLSGDLAQEKEELKPILRQWPLW